MAQTVIQPFESADVAGAARLLNERHAAHRRSEPLLNGVVDFEQQVSAALAGATGSVARAWLAKIGTFGVLWPVAYRCFVRHADGPVPEVIPVEWRDIERELERADRRARRARTTGSQAQPRR